MHMPTCLVTGSSGLIGSEVAEPADRIREAENQGNGCSLPVRGPLCVAREILQCGRLSKGLAGLARQRERHRGATARFTGRMNLAAVRGHETLRNRQPEPGPAR